MPQEFDYIIIGGGLAGLQLALSLSEDPYFDSYSIAIIDSSLKNTNDKTWCFWEKGKGKWDTIITKTWDHGKFISSNFEKDLNLAPYTYKMLRAIDFYKFAKTTLNNKSNFQFILDEIEEIDVNKSLAIGKKGAYAAKHFFDSRIGSNFLENPNCTKIYQHFKGLRIKSSTPVFDKSTFTMMDFRLKFPDSTSFTYVLPITETEALVEYTFFTPFLTEEGIYDTYLESYIKDILNIKQYEVLESEMGVIPMTEHSFHKDSSSKVTKIGTAGSWVKASTGYSFKHTEKKVEIIISNLKAKKAPHQGLLKQLSRFYDAIFLDVLDKRNDLGEQLFSKFYSNNSPQEIFKYLDEETNLQEELMVMMSIYHPEFIKSFFRKLFQN